MTLSTIGFGMGNYKDELMEQLADKGNGNNFYIDSRGGREEGVPASSSAATLEVVAKDVKLQVDFDPAMVARYRLVGYENRDIADDDFRNDKVDAGEIGAGHQVTALYEVELTAKGQRRRTRRSATVRIRHKAAARREGDRGRVPDGRRPGARRSRNASADFRFAFAVAAFADVLRGGEDAEHWSLARSATWRRPPPATTTIARSWSALIDKAIAARSGRTAQR